MSWTRIVNNYTECVTGDVISLKANDAMPMGIALTNAGSDGTIMVGINGIFGVNCGSVCFGEFEEENDTETLIDKTYKAPTIKREVPKIELD